MSAQKKIVKGKIAGMLNKGLAE